MSARFAALEARVNSAVFSHLANAAPTLAGVPIVRAIFDAAYQLAELSESGMATTAPVLTLPTASVPANVVGLAVVVNGKSFTVVAHEPDGTGISLLMLQVNRGGTD